LLRAAIRSSCSKVCLLRPAVCIVQRVRRWPCHWFHQQAVEVDTDSVEQPQILTYRMQPTVTI